RADMFANQIAAELDCSYQLIGKRGRILADKELVERSENKAGRRVFLITQEAQDLYFNEDGEKDKFDFDEPKHKDKA
ncbi:MAG TPA: hypothetical protein VIH09_08145, partial [Flavobacterium sp.]|uniref:hypothetical protein n=1 Tax=Flavobacterium sp. TaxID=239 RepID=UPI002F418EDC